MSLHELIAKTVANAAGPGSARILRIDIQRGQAELLFDSWQLVNP
jgi:glycerol-3-phosphate dehydrogenase